MIVTMRSSSSDVISPALYYVRDIRDKITAPLRNAYIIPLVQVHVRFLAHQVRISTSHALYLGESVHDLLFAIDVCLFQFCDQLFVLTGLASRVEYSR